MRYSLTNETLETILRNRDVGELDRESLESLLTREPGLDEYKPEPYYRVDPRTGDRIIYNAARARRPHENEAARGGEPEEEDLNAAPSIISQGKTTGVIDVAELSEGFTFINMNLFPILYPLADGGQETVAEDPRSDGSVTGGKVHGGHFLQWTSSYQDRDWYNMPLDDCAVVMSRLARLEAVLLGKSRSDNPGADHSGGYVSIIKNCGRLVGGSIAHGHQQIGYSTAVPRRCRDLVRFEAQHNRLFSAHMLEHTPEELVLRDYGEAMLVVPYFMRRPYDMMLLLKDTGKQHLCALSDQQIRHIAQGWQDAIRGMRAVLAGLDKQIAYNITANTGPGTGMFMDFLPYTQEMGGFEHLGLYVCQGTPAGCADYLRNVMNKSEQTRED